MNAPRSDDAGGREVVIAVLGMTGTGKSTLIRQLSGPNMGINYGGLDAGAQDIRASGVVHQGIKLTLLDTPGYDDTSRSGADILASVMSFLHSHYGEDFRLSGVILLQNITVRRVAPFPPSWWRGIRGLVVGGDLSNVVLASTHWASLPEEICVQLESDIRDIVWKLPIDHGAIVTRYMGSAASAWAVLEQLPLKPSHLVFPEYKGVHAKKESIPLFNSRKSKPLESTAHDGSSEPSGEPQPLESGSEDRGARDRSGEEREKREMRERERKRMERGGVKMQQWLGEFGESDMKAVRQPPQPPRYASPKHIRNNLARLVDDLFRPTASDVPSGGDSPGRGKEKEHRRAGAPEPTCGVPPDLFDKPDRGFESLTTLVDRISNLAKKAEGQGEVARDLQKESVQAKRVNDVLFKDKQLLQMSTPVFEQLSPVGQRVIAAAAECSMDSLLGALSPTGNSGTESNAVALEKTLGSALVAVQKANEAVQGHLRHYLLESNAFNRPDTLTHASQLQGGPAADLGLVDDAKLRARNVAKRPDLFHSDGSGGLVPKGQPCHACGGGDDEMEVPSGQIDESANDDFLTFPGRLDSVPIKALIDTGGGCNLINANWVEKQKIKPDPSKSQKLVMADGSESKSCDVVVVEWSFYDRKKLWVNVEFVVVKGREFDALIGLPFLKHTETIHNKDGRLVFPEFKGVHTKKESIPLFHFNKLKPSK